MDLVANRRPGGSCGGVVGVGDGCEGQGAVGVALFYVWGAVLIVRRHLVQCFYSRWLIFAEISTRVDSESVNLHN